MEFDDIYGNQPHLRDPIHKVQGPIRLEPTHK